VEQEQVAIYKHAKVRPLSRS